MIVTVYGMRSRQYCFNRSAYLIAEVAPTNPRFCKTLLQMYRGKYDIHELLVVAFLVLLLLSQFCDIFTLKLEESSLL